MVNMNGHIITGKRNKARQQGSSNVVSGFNRNNTQITFISHVIGCNV